MKENFIERDGKEMFEEEFLNFAGYNLQRRALPDARDGLKWGARKLLHAQMLGKLTYDKPFKKAIKSVSQAMSFSYTHGDASAYGTFIRMAKPFAYRIPLQEANGNYGTLINPEDHSSSRYVELRGSEAAAALLKDLDKDTITEWEDTYDMEGQFPKVLPAKGFWNGVNGCISIGSGMSSSLPPLNLEEVNKALVKLLWNPTIDSDEILCYPDFPTGATILNKSEIKESLIKGRGAACKICAKIDWNDSERCFIVKQLPYSVYTNTICNELAVLMEEDEFCGIKEFSDFTRREPDLRIYLSKGASPKRVLEKLYKETSLQSYFSINMTVLDKGITPTVMGQRQLFEAHLTHEKEVYTRGFQFDLRKINNRLLIIDGLMKAISMIDNVVKTIKSCSDSRSANLALQKLLSITEEQAKAILDLKLSRLTHLDITKLQDERSSLEKDKDRIEAILKDDSLLKKEIEKGLLEVIKKFSDARRTTVIDYKEPAEPEQEQPKFYTYLLSTGELALRKTQTSRFSKGEIINCFITTNSDYLVCFTKDGKSNIINLNDKEVGKNYPLSSDTVLVESPDTLSACKYLVFFTRNGIVKRSLTSEYNFNTKRATIGIKLRDGDNVIAVHLMGEKEEDYSAIILSSTYQIRFSAKEIPSTGRATIGVKGITLKEGEQVQSAKLILNSDGSDIPFSVRGSTGRKLSKATETSRKK